MLYIKSFEFYGRLRASSKYYFLKILKCTVEERENLAIFFFNEEKKLGNKSQILFKKLKWGSARYELDILEW